MALNKPKMSTEEVMQRDIEATVLLRCAREVYEYQLEEGKHFLHEHPELAKSWMDANKVLELDRRIPLAGMVSVCLFKALQALRSERAV